MACDYRYCPNPKSPGRFFNHPEDGLHNLFSRLEPGVKMHMGCYIDYCVRESIEEQTKDDV